MSFLKGAGKTARFAFVKVPMAILGVNQLKGGNQLIADLWRSLSNPVCPACDKGVMSIKTEVDPLYDQSSDGTMQRLYPWSCKKCGWEFLETNDPRKVNAHCVQLRNERVKASLSTLEMAQREPIARSHKLHSRAYFTAFTITMLGAIYMTATGVSFITVANWLSMAFLFFVFGIKKSYRAWQVSTGNIFIEGSFWFWFRNEKWIQ